jgi:hypothetical protein
MDYYRKYDPLGLFNGKTKGRGLRKKQTLWRAVASMEKGRWYSVESFQTMLKDMPGVPLTERQISYMLRIFEINGILEVKANKTQWSMSAGKVRREQLEYRLKGVEEE